MQDESQALTSPILQLPFHVLHDIWRVLPPSTVDSSRQSWRLVCSAFRDIVNMHARRLVLTAASSGEEVRLAPVLAAIASAQAGRGGLVELDLSKLQPHQQHHAELLHAVEHGQLCSLSTFTVQHTEEHEQSGAQALAAVLRRCHLSSLGLVAPSEHHAVNQHTPYIAQALLAMPRPSSTWGALHCLRLTNWLLTSATLHLLTQAFHQCLPCLVELDLTEWRAQADDLPAVAQAVGAALASGHLRILRLSSDAALSSIDTGVDDFEQQLSAQLCSHGCALTELALCQSVFPPEATLPVLLHNTHLRNLQLGTFAWEDGGHGLGALTHLTQLWLRYDTEDLSTLGSGLQRLTGLLRLHLDFFDYQDRSADSGVVVAAFHAMPHLASLSMCHLDRLSLSALLQSCPNSLQELCLDNVMLEDSATQLAHGLGPALQRLTTLERLQLRQLFFESDGSSYLVLAGAVASALPFLTKLRHVVFRNDAAMADPPTSFAIRAASLSVAAAVCCTPSLITADMGLHALDAAAQSLVRTMLSSASCRVEAA